jgi:glycosyltransferase involved in cell wall biosynthesis
VPLALSYAVMRRFHSRARATLVATPSIEQDLARRGFTHLHRWSRGVDLDRFRPGIRSDGALDLPRPIFLCVGRLAKEKNLSAFLSLDLPGSKVVVGDGPDRQMLQAAFPAAHFLGAMDHAALAGIYAAADVFVFPSLTDTFGLVLIEALASGLPVAAFPVAGPRDVIGASKAGALSQDLRSAALAALHIDRALCRAHAETFTWDKATDQFLTALAAPEATRQPLARPDRVDDLLTRHISL